jgi:hypothetical protein
LRSSHRSGALPFIWLGRCLDRLLVSSLQILYGIRLVNFSKSTSQANTVLGQRLVGGQNEKQVVELFATVRLAQTDDGEPGDVDIANGQDIPNEDKDEAEYTSTKRYAYSQEHKLAAIDYFQTTWKVNKDGTYKRMSN